MAADGSGTGGAGQLNVWKANFGASAVVSAATVPEPTAAALALVAGIASLRGRRAPARPA